MIKSIIAYGLAFLIIGSGVFAVSFWLFNDNYRDSMSLAVSATGGALIAELLRPYLKKKKRIKKELVQISRRDH